ALAKRAHAKNLVPLLASSLEEAGMLNAFVQTVDSALTDELAQMLTREPEMLEALKDFLAQTKRPAIDAIAVTHGPGLAPALWVGVNFARALARAWNIPIVPINHMEGHFLAAVAQTENGKDIKIEDVQLPVLGLLISGGHTELDLMKDWLTYEKL